MQQRIPAEAGWHKLTTAEGLRYTVVLPAGYQPDRTYPLILALHYGGPVTPWYGAGLLEQIVEPGLKGLGAIMVAPDCAHGGWDNEASEGAVLALLDLLVAQYPIEPGQTILTGYSMGGKGTWYLAARQQARFAVAIPMASRPMPIALTAAWHIPIYALHGEQDELFPLAGTAAFIEELRAQGVAVQFDVLPGVSHHELAGFAGVLQRLVPAIAGHLGR
jgi:predicted peptidase